MNVHICGTDAEARAFFCADDDHACFALGPLPVAVAARLFELESIAAPGAVLTLARDWEHCIIGALDGDPRFDALAFTDDGRVGHGGCNLPRYFATIGDLLADDARRFAQGGAR